ncbi:MAG: diguanylate cyclase [Acidimicrobiia bacterium]|nr:diguanylate cyclase [Acidimicrobiia bacterium]
MLGCVALVVGVVAAVADVPVLGVVAGSFGIAAGLAASHLGGRADALDERLEQADARVAHLTDELALAVEAGEGAAAQPAASQAAPVVPADDEEALVDAETGLFGERYFDVTLASRVAAARRHLRPVAVVLVDVVSGIRTGEPEVVDPVLVADHVRATLREADTACRLDDGRFALLLEDTPENGAVWTVERLRRALAATRSDLTLWAGVACYPAHAFHADELHDRAVAALVAAKQWRQDRIEVATSSE